MLPGSGTIPTGSTVYFDGSLRDGPSSLTARNGFGFVAQSSADAADALGCAGSGMGLWGDGDGLDCVSPALAVRVDTHFCCVLLSTCC